MSERLTSRFANEEKFGLISQMRRAAVSVPSNLAEGQARRTVGEFVQFISHAEGTVAELDTQLTLSIELGFCSKLDAAEAGRWLDPGTSKNAQRAAPLRFQLITHNFELITPQ